MANWGPFEFVRRAVTLPQSYNSLSDIARAPLGAIGNALPYIAIASGMGWIKIPGVPGGWLKGGIGKVSLGSLSQWVKKNPAQAALLGAGLYNAYQSSQERARAEGALGNVQNIYAQLLAQSLPFASALSQARLFALGQAMNQPDTAIAQAHKALDAQLQNINRIQSLSGLRSLSADRMRAQALANFAGQVMALRNSTPWQRLAYLLNAGTGYDAGSLAGLTGLSQQKLAGASMLESQTLSALASILPYILEEI
ncbi:MAG: hypothetical protein KatS3mg023_0599 [Armatimonadota bacterium]|nr:MAG: hypothetical protein KatS3mg023_0599 [Armatimonadota bacterium]